jgi:hypothetical protein
MFTWSGRSPRPSSGWIQYAWSGAAALHAWRLANWRRIGGGVMGINIGLDIGAISLKLAADLGKKTGSTG